jgi:hypothetical protein
MHRRASRRTQVLLVVGLASLAPALGACGDVAIAPPATPVAGSGDVVSEDRTSGDIERISVAAPIAVVVQTGSPVSVTLTAQPNVLPTVTTEVRDGQLIVNVPPPGYTTAMPVQLSVVTPSLEALTLSGGASGLIQRSGGDLRLDLSGGATIEGTGTLDTLDLTASSKAVVSFGELVVNTCRVTMSGGSAAELNVVRLLEGDASGGATVTLAHPGAAVSVSTTSGASVQGG